MNHPRIKRVKEVTRHARRINFMIRVYFSLLSTILFLSLVTLPVLVVSAGEPNESTYFAYDYHQEVTDGSGAYYEYSEDTKGTGRYDVISWGPDEVVMRAKYSWVYDNNEGGYKTGKFNNIFSFSLTNRSYTSEIIDLDDEEYVNQEPSTLKQWIWIPPDVKKGDGIEILDETWTVTETDYTLWSKWIPRKVIEVKVTGEGNRNDDYGNFRYSYEDNLYYDKVTGMFFAERYYEYDTGYWEGQSATFDYTIKIDVTDSSYKVEIDWYTLVGMYSFIILTILGIIGGIAYLAYRGRFARRMFQIKDLPEYEDRFATIFGEDVTFRRVWKMKDYPHAMNNSTNYFEPFLEHWTQKALLAKDRVAVAVSKTHGLIGYGTYNKETKTGTILCKNTEVTEILRAFLGCKDFFTEKRHLFLATAQMQKDKDVMRKIQSARNEAYNVFETHGVYQLFHIKPTSYDTDLVRPITRSDLPAVIRLARKIYKEKARRWITACFKAGDIGYVAVLEGNIVGFGFACVSGTHGRLHTLGVSKEHRNMGIGKELHRARLEAMRLMGVTTVIDEIADWNLASIRISTLSGFKPVGSMYVETSRTKKIKMNIIRR